MSVTLKAAKARRLRAMARLMVYLSDWIGLWRQYGHRSSQVIHGDHVKRLAKRIVDANDIIENDPGLIARHERRVARMQELRKKGTDARDRS